jgi:predicted phage tail protein
MRRLLVSRGDLGELGVGGGGRKRGAREERMDSGGIFGCGFRGCARRFTGSLVLVDKWILVAVPYCMAYSSAGHAALAFSFGNQTRMDGVARLVAPMLCAAMMHALDYGWVR